MASASPFASPLEARAWRRSAQRAIRLAINDFNAARDEWQEAAISGRVAAAEATNAHLQQLFLPKQPLGALSSHGPDLVAAAVVKLEDRQEAAMQRVDLAVHSLTEAEGSMQAAAKIDFEDNTAGVASESQPVFAALPLSKLVDELRGAAHMYEAELQTKLAVADGLRSILDRRKADGSEPTEQARAEMQVLLAAWMLQPHVDDDGVDATLAALADEMKGF